ncbi:MAG TPA: 30S ribosome-binding factor RbfA [Cyclobacteriaceae bacterium]
MDSNRQLKFAKLIQKDLSDIFHKDGRSFFGDAFVTITQVKMSPDLSVSKIYLSLFMVNDKKALIEGLEERKSEIRKLLGNKIGKQVRKIPELIFFNDETEDNARRIEKIIDNLDIPSEDKE